MTDFLFPHFPHNTRSSSVDPCGRSAFFGPQPLFSQKREGADKKKENRRMQQVNWESPEWLGASVKCYGKSRRIRTEENAFELWELWILTTERSFSGKWLEHQRIGLISILGLSVAQIQQSFQLLLLQLEALAYFTLVSHILKHKIVTTQCSLSS